MSETIRRAILLCVLAAFGGQPFLLATQQDQKKAEPPQPGESSSRKPGQPDQTTDDSDQPSPPATRPSANSATDVSQKPDANPKYDPFPAVHDMDVGSFYLHKGDIDAAIDRFLDAAKLRPNYALPRLLLGEAYEKKGDKASAVKYYKEYLQVFPTAPDAKKIQKKIEKLSKE